jgi:hypothetical protein
MTMTHQPFTPAGDAGGIDPALDPQGYLTDLITRYFRPGLADRLIRTWVPYGIGLALSYVAIHWHIVVPEQHTSTVVLLTTGLVTAGYYALATLLERRFPRLGRWMIALNLTKARPTYAKPAAAAQVEAAAARTPGQP